MKILLIHTNYTQLGGEDVVVQQEMELLQQHHQVNLLRFQNKSGAKGAFQFLAAIWNLAAARKVRAAINEFRPDVVHLHNWHFASGPIIIRAVKKMNLPLVHTVHNYRLLCPSAILLHNNQLFTKSLKQHFPWSAISKGVYRNSILQTFWLALVVWWHKKIGTWSKINQFVCLTPFAVALFKTSTFIVAPQKFSIKPNFTLPPTVQATTSKGNHFLYIGRLSEEKGIRLLLKAVENTDFQLKIAGDGPLKDQVTQAAKQHTNITYLGTLSKTEVAQQLQTAQVLVFPSIWYEGMPMTILEAFSTKTPVIASNLGAMSTMIEHQKNGLHFEAGNASALQHALAQWSGFTEEQKTTMRNGAYASYQQLYAPEQQLTYFNRIYKEAIHQ